MVRAKKRRLAPARGPWNTGEYARLVRLEEVLRNAGKGGRVEALFRWATEQASSPELLVSAQVERGLEILEEILADANRAVLRSSLPDGASPGKPGGGSAKAPIAAQAGNMAPPPGLSLKRQHGVWTLKDGRRIPVEVVKVFPDTGRIQVRTRSNRVYEVRDSQVEVLRGAS